VPLAIFTVQRKIEVYGKLAMIHPMCIPMHQSHFQYPTCIDGIPEQLEASSLTLKHASRDRSTMKPESHGEVASFWSQRPLELAGNLLQSHATFESKPRHDDGVIRLRIGKASYGDVTVC